MKLTVSMVDSSQAKSSKTFANISDTYASDEALAYLKNLANTYAAMTSSVTTTAKKIVETPIELA